MSSQNITVLNTDESPRQSKKQAEATNHRIAAAAAVLTEERAEAANNNVAAAVLIEECTKATNHHNDAVLTKEQVEQFVNLGYVMVKSAFDPSVAADVRAAIWKRLNEEGIKQDDTSTWELRKGIPECYKDGYPWSKVLSTRLHLAIDQLIGKERWEKGQFGCGWWVITFPGISDPSEGFQASGKFHIDGASFQHFPTSKEQALLPIFLFNDIAKEEGGTLLCSASHIDVGNILFQHEQHGLQGGKLSHLARQVPDITANLVEVNGRAGDVMLCHPFLLHARSTNLSKRGVDGVRIMCNPCISLKQPMQIDRADDKALSPLERSVLLAKQRSMFPMSFAGSSRGNSRGNSRPSKKRRWK